jgi:hypothetical protein
MIDARRVTWNKFHAEDSNVWCYSTQFSRPGDLDPWFCARLSSRSSVFGVGWIGMAVVELS